MKVRELLVSVKMLPDTQSISQTEQTISSIKESMQGIGSAAATAGGQINGSVIESIDRIIELLEESNKQFYDLAQGLAEGFKDAFGKAKEDTGDLTKEVENLGDAADKTGKKLESIYGPRFKQNMEKLRASIKANATEVSSLSTYELGNLVTKRARAMGINASEREGFAIAKELKQKKKLFDEIGSSGSKAIDKVNNSMSYMYMRAIMGESALGRLLDRTVMFGTRFAAFAGIGFSIQQAMMFADQWKVIKGQIKNVVTSEEEALTVQQKLFEMSSRTRQGYQQAASLFTSVSRSSKSLGKSTDEILAFTEDVAKAMLVGGGSAESQQAALIQLGQALGSGTLRGDELNSILEQAPVLAKTIADGMKITIGQLREYGRQGKLTAAALFDAVRSQSENLNKQLANTPWTVRQATGLVRDAMMRLFGTLEDKVGVVSGVAKIISLIARAINKVTDNMDHLIHAFKLATAGAVIFYAVQHFQSIIAGFKTILYMLGLIKLGYTSASSAEAIWNAASIKAAFAHGRAWFIANLPIMLMIMAIALLVLALEDLYGWINGKDSLIGRHFGKWNDVIAEVSKRWETWKQQMSEALPQFADLIVKAVNGLIDFLANLNPIFALVKKIRDNWADIKKFISEAIDKITEFTGIDLRKIGKGEVEVNTNKVLDNANQIASSDSYQNIAQTKNVNNTFNAIINAQGNTDGESLADTFLGRLAERNAEYDNPVLEEW